MNHKLKESGAKLIELCRHKGAHIVTAESCTGGLIGATLTEIAGSSDTFWGGFITYDNRAKELSVNVEKHSLDIWGAVSKEVVTQMVRGAVAKSSCELGIAVSGIAGPGGGSIEKPVGTVWIAVSYKGVVRAESFLFKGDRASVREQTVEKSIIMAQSFFYT